MKNRCT